MYAAFDQTFSLVLLTPHTQCVPCLLTMPAASSSVCPAVSTVSVGSGDRSAGDTPSPWHPENPPPDREREGKKERKREREKNRQRRLILADRGAEKLSCSTQTLLPSSVMTGEELRDWVTVRVCDCACVFLYKSNLEQICVHARLISSFHSSSTPRSLHSAPSSNCSTREYIDEWESHLLS